MTDPRIDLIAHIWHDLAGKPYPSGAYLYGVVQGILLHEPCEQSKGVAFASREEMERIQSHAQYVQQLERLRLADLAEIRRLQDEVKRLERNLATADEVANSWHAEMIGAKTETDRLRADAELGRIVRAMPYDLLLRHEFGAADGIDWSAERHGPFARHRGKTPEEALRAAGVDEPVDMRGEPQSLGLESVARQAKAKGGKG